MVGVSGTPSGVPTIDGDDVGEEPIALVATTVTEYPVPLTRPVMVQPVEEVVQVNDALPSEAVAT